MIKSELIKMLETIDGDPEIMIWNNDEHCFSPVKNALPTTAYKVTKEWFFETARLRDCRDANDWSLQLTEEDIGYLEEEYLNEDWIFTDFDVHYLYQPQNLDNTDKFMSKECVWLDWNVPTISED